MVTQWVRKITTYKAHTFHHIRLQPTKLQPTSRIKPTPQFLPQTITSAILQTQFLGRRHKAYTNCHKTKAATQQVTSTALQIHQVWAITVTTLVESQLTMEFS